MGFRKPDIGTVYDILRKSISEINSTHNDGFVQMSLKEELYVLKCWLEDRYKELPEFVGEEQWEQLRMIEILRRP